MVFGAIEAGGTKFVCAIGDKNLNIEKRASFPTTTPEETMNLVIAFFNDYQTELESIGVGSFGPIDVQQDSSTYGYITSTPKSGWQDFDFVGSLKKHFDVPIAWTTDVNAAAYGEYVCGEGRGKNSVVYYTIGTGIGGGAIQKGEFIEGFSHPEMGHMLVVPHDEDSFQGNCPFHKNCLEGMAAGPAIEARTGRKGQDISETDAVWESEAFYIAQCVYNTTLILSPDVIILGGGVMQQSHMVERVRVAFHSLMKDYVRTPEMKNYIVTPSLKNNAGVIGCLALAKKEI